ncbi:MAG: hypothetical protein MUC49_07355 [Raineya sp.]|jgi:hypothetical protein|nr:hypothetical protein [Raineya sp.]
MRKKIILDIVASLLSSYVLAVWLDYNFIGGNSNVEPVVYGILFGILSIVHITIFYKLRKKQPLPLPKINKIFDLIFPVFLISIILIFIGIGIYIGDIYDENVGQRIMNSVYNDFTRNFIDLYAGGKGALIVKPLGLFLFLIFSSISRFLGASLKIQKIPKPKV